MGSRHELPRRLKVKVQVILADDHRIVREGVRMVLETAPDIEVLAEVGNGKEAVAAAQKVNPHLALLDVVMPVLDGFAAAQQIARLVPRCKILMLSSYSDEERVRDLIAIGVFGYVIKQAAAQELLQAVREVYRGNYYFSSALSRGLVEPSRNSMAADAFIPRKKLNLTRREQEALKLIARGFPNRE
jgi:DNA-binding NarL/FixJ family response regulator